MHRPPSPLFPPSRQPSCSSPQRQGSEAATLQTCFLHHPHSHLRPKPGVHRGRDPVLPPHLGLCPPWPSPCLWGPSPREQPRWPLPPQVHPPPTESHLVGQQPSAHFLPHGSLDLACADRKPPSEGGWEGAQTRPTTVIKCELHTHSTLPGPTPSGDRPLMPSFQPQPLTQGKSVFIRRLGNQLLYERKQGCTWTRRQEPGQHLWGPNLGHFTHCSGSTSGHSLRWLCSASAIVLNSPSRPQLGLGAPGPALGFWRLVVPAPVRPPLL